MTARIEGEKVEISDPFGSSLFTYAYMASRPSVLAAGGGGCTPLWPHFMYLLGISPMRVFSVAGTLAAASPYLIDISPSSHRLQTQPWNRWVYPKYNRYNVFGTKESNACAQDSERNPLLFCRTLTLGRRLQSSIGTRIV
jgi:hypothetical protein